jgi:hypothetical protein
VRAPLPQRGALALTSVCGAPPHRVIFDTPSMVSLSLSFISSFNLCLIDSPLATCRHAKFGTPTLSISSRLLVVIVMTSDMFRSPLGMFNSPHFRATDTSGVDAGTRRRLRQTVFIFVAPSAGSCPKPLLQYKFDIRSGCMRSVAAFR